MPMRWVLLAAIAACQNPSKLDELAPMTSTTAAPTPPLELDGKAIDAWVAATVKERGVVGASLVIIRDGTPVLATGYGTRAVGSAQPIDADTPFALGSISKQFACALVYTLVDQGRLAMDHAVGAYYPELARANDITLADLGGHTAGYRDYYPLDYVDRRMHAPIAPDALLAEYAGRPLDFEPGTRFSYSNTGFVLLARIAEKVTGTPYAQLLDERVFRPLGLQATLARPANAATGHVAFLLDPPAAAPLEAAGWLLGAGDIWASATTLAAWDLALADGKLLSPASLRAMTTARALRDGRSTSYGCGLYTRVLDGETVLSHGGWVGGFYTFNAVVPRTRSAVVLLTNDEHADLADVHDRLVRLVTRDASAIPAIAGPPAAEAARALIVQLQRGTLDRATLGADLDAYFDDARVQAASAALRALGEPTVTLVSRRERGGLEHASLKVAFATRTVDASLFRSPDGKIRQLLLSP